MKAKKIKRKLQKAYLKSLSAFARGLIARGYSWKQVTGAGL
jgi:hypothetical protein